MKWLLFFLIPFICKNPNSNNNNLNPRKIEINTKYISVVEGDPWHYDEPQKQDVFNNYYIDVGKDSSRVIIYAIERHFDSPGTRNTIELDTMGRPVGLKGRREYNEFTYSYKWSWDENGRLSSVVELVNGKANQIINLKKSNTKK